MLVVGSSEVHRKALHPKANSVKVKHLTCCEAEQINLLYFLCCSAILVPTLAQFKLA